MTLPYHTEKRNRTNGTRKGELGDVNPIENGKKLFFQTIKYINK